MATSLPISVVVPTYRRERVLVETLEAILALDPPPAELIVCDQTPAHEAQVESDLAALEESGQIRWIRLPKPSIPHAMNVGLLNAREKIVLYLDDDVKPSSGLLKAHFTAQSGGARIVAGQVLQPGEEPEPLEGEKFSFRSSVPQKISELMAGNFSVRRTVALALRGFDENFVGAAYRFERDFSDRALAAGHEILFEPAAPIRHLRASSGGTRAYGSHLTTIRPVHSVGEYYYILTSRTHRKARPILSRIMSSIWTRHHLRGPWWIPITLMAELSGLAWAASLTLRGPRYLASCKETPT